MILALPTVLIAQNHSRDTPEKYGINFIQGVNWNDLQKVAKEQGKLIFIDCYTTWCVPCKKMEKDVYSDDSVGAFFNNRFISLKLQMDSTSADNDMVKRAYADAAMIGSNYEIVSFPTMLFFTSDGKLLSKNIGLVTSKEFLEMGKNVLDPKKNYYTLLSSYQKGEIDDSSIGSLITGALEIAKDSGLAKIIATDYFAHLKADKKYTKENIELMRLFTKKSKDKGFEFFFYNVDNINNIMGDDDYSQSIIHSIIFKEIMTPALAKYKINGLTPAWNKLETLLENSYGKYYRDRISLAAHVKWASQQNDWEARNKYFVEFIDRYVYKSNNLGHWFAFGLNNAAWSIFQKSNKKSELERALLWSNKALMMDPIPNWMDTYANILYKLGKKELAIQWESTANKLDPSDQDIQSMLDKMKKSIPTWPSN